MRCLIRIDGKWQTEHPDNLSRWMRTNDGAEAVVVDGKKYYCGNESLMLRYRQQWEGERKVGDMRESLMFIVLDRILFESER